MRVSFLCSRSRSGIPGKQTGSERILPFFGRQRAVGPGEYVPSLLPPLQREHLRASETQYWSC